MLANHLIAYHLAGKYLTAPLQLSNSATPAQRRHYTMSNVYTALPPRCIRVLELQPGPSDMLLACRLVVQLIADKSYEAISYVWGDPTPTATIKCIGNTHDGEIGIATNLAAALVVFRLPDRPRRIRPGDLNITLILAESLTVAALLEIDVSEVDNGRFKFRIER